MRFRDHRIVGDILELATRYRAEGADELVFYDITASPESRSVDRSWIARIAQVLDIPFCVAGGIRSVEDAEAVLNSGAEKISVNSPALADPSLIDSTARRTLDWVREAQDRGAGEIVLNCMASDGVRTGYDIAQLREVREACRVPLIASGGAGAPEHFADVFIEARVDGALAASVFHSAAIAIPDLKRYLRERHIEVRL